MNKVLDSSAVLHAVLPEPHQAKALQLLDDYRNGLVDLLAPDIYPLETLNALSKAERQKRILPGEAQSLWKIVMADAPVYVPHAPLLQKAFALSLSTRTAMYDLLYVCLAEQEGCEMVTADDRLVKNLQPQFPFIVHLKDLP